MQFEGLAHWAVRDETASQEARVKRPTSLPDSLMSEYEVVARAPEDCVEVPALIRCADFTILSLGFLFVNEYKYYSHLPVGLL